MSAFQTFAALHVPGRPFVLFNIWDAGSARAAANAGAKAIATGSASVAGAHGVEDAEGLPIELALANAERVVKAVNLPVTIDFEGAYAAEPDAAAANVARLAKTGAIGCNFEDQRIGGEGLYTLKEQTARILAIREAVGPDFFINARTDLFLKAPPASHDAALVDEALQRADAYAQAGASGFFVPLLSDLELLERVCAESPLPVNFMAFPGGPTARAVADCGVARISHGPFPWKLALRAFEEAAREALAV